MELSLTEDMIDEAIFAYYMCDSDDHEDSLIAALKALIDLINRQ